MGPAAESMVIGQGPAGRGYPVFGGGRPGVPARRGVVACRVGVDRVRLLTGSARAGRRTTSPGAADFRGRRRKLRHDGGVQTPQQVQTIGRELIAALVEKARSAPRGRVHHNFHASPEENPNRFLNVMTAGAYIAPHRHREPPKAEALVVLEGEVALFTFDGQGAVEAVHRIGPAAGVWGVDVAPGAWHTLAVMSAHAVCYEVKPGPYDAATDKEFAPWAPREGDPAAPEYLRLLVERATRTGSE